MCWASQPSRTGEIRDQVCVCKQLVIMELELLWSLSAGFVNEQLLLCFGLAPRRTLHRHYFLTSLGYLISPVLGSQKVLRGRRSFRRQGFLV